MAVPRYTSQLSTPALEHTSNLLRLYLHAHNYVPSQVPQSFHIWSFLSVLAAVAQDKYYFQKLAGETIKVNLYVMLIGPSGLGKDTAINTAMDYIKPYSKEIRRFVGRTTNAAFLDFICKTEFDATSNTRYQLPSRVLLVTHELAQALGEGTRAQDFLKLMVSVFTATGREFEEHTRQYGHFRCENPCISWISGTTQEWLIDTIGVKQLRGGFLRRLIPIVEDYNLDNWRPWAIFPEDYTDVVQYIQARIAALVSSDGGQMYLAQDALEYVNKWYEGWIKEAKALDDAVVTPLYAGGHDLLLKLSMLLCLSDGGSLIIQLHQVKLAESLLRELIESHYSKLLEYSYAGGPTNDAKHLERLFKRQPGWEISLSDLLKKVWKRGIDRKRLHEALNNLLMQGVVQAVNKPGSRAVWYKWYM